MMATKDYVRAIQDINEHMDAVQERIQMPATHVETDDLYEIYDADRMELKLLNEALGGIREAMGQ